MKFIIDPKIFENYPGFVNGILIVKNIDNSGKAEEVMNLIRAAEKQTREIKGIEQVNDYPKIAAWREAHRKFGSNPKKDPPSVQGIFRRVYKGGELPGINKLVDIYNYISLKYVIPAGGEDLDKCFGDIMLTYANGSEGFIELGAGESNPPEKGEVVYRDDAGVICRKFNWREAGGTKLDENTKNAVLVFEGLPPTTPEELEGALREAQKLGKSYCGGEAEFSILSSANPEYEL